MSLFLLHDDAALRADIIARHARANPGCRHVAAYNAARRAAEAATAAWEGARHTHGTPRVVRDAALAAAVAMDDAVDDAARAVLSTVIDAAQPAATLEEEARWGDG